MLIKWEISLMHVRELRLICSFILHVQEEAPKPLDRVVVCVSKKLSKKQSELNGVAASLGAEYR